MKRVLLWILGIVIVLGVAGAVLLGRIDTQFVVKQIADATAKATGKPLIFTSAPSLSLLPPGVKFGQADWGEIKDGQGLAVSVKGGVVELELTPLFSGNLVVREVRLDNPVLEMREGKAVAAAPAQQNQAHEQTAQNQAPAATAPSDELPVELMRLVVRQGEVRYVDAQGTTLHIENLNLSVENLRRREEAGVQCDFAFDFKENAQKAVLAGNLALDAKLRYYAPHLTFRQISLTFTPLHGLLPKEAGPAQLICEGALNLQTRSLRLASARLTTPQARLTLGGEATLTPPAFKGNVSLEGSPRKLAALAGQKLKPVDNDLLSFKSALEYAGDKLHLRQIVMQLDDIPVRGDLSLALDAPLAVSGGIQAGMINLDAYLPLPESGKAAKGVNIVNIIQVETGERVQAMLHFREQTDEELYLFMTTRNGTVKRLEVSALKNLRNNGIRALTLDEGDQLISVTETRGHDRMLIATHDGQAVCFDETDVRAMGRTAVGVRGIRLREGDYVIGAARADAGKTVLSITENGFGKRTPVEEYRITNRGGLGIRNYMVTDKTGCVVGMKMVDGTEDLLLVTEAGILIRTPVENIRVAGRATQGVIVMRFKEEGDHVISMALADPEEKDETAETPDTEETV